MKVREPIPLAALANGDRLVDFYDNGNARGQSEARPYICIFFECCGQYVRVYRRRSEREYVGRCPGCLRVVRVAVGPHGTKERIFTAR